MSVNKERVQGEIRKILSLVITTKVKNPLTSLASVNEVRVTNDYSYATIYVVHLDKTKTDDLVALLNKTKGFIRSELAHNLKIYKTPELIFVKDELYEQGRHIDDLIEKVSKK